MADAWGGSFGVAWGNSWGSGTAPPVTPDTPTSAGGRRSSGTQYRAKTLGRELREKERDAKRQARELHRLAMVRLREEGVTSEIGVKKTRTLLDLAIEEQQPTIEVTATSGPELQPAVNAIVAWIVARALERQNIESDEADIELLLLATL